MIIIAANRDIFGLSEQHYGKIKRVGMLNDEPILYGDPNLLKNNDLYYIIGAKQVYRYVKCEIRHTGGTSSPGTLNPTPIPVGGNVFDPNATTKEYYFETINGSDSEVLSVPEDERGKIRNAGYLFNEIIYSGDPNLVDNGLLFYHDTLPYISIISNVDGIINVSTKTIRLGSIVGTIINEYMVYTPHDYSKDYFTIKATTDTDFSFHIPSELVTSKTVTEVYYKINDGDWTSFNKSDQDELEYESYLLSGDIIQFKGIANRYAGLLIVSQDESPEEFFSNIYLNEGGVKVYGNILSLFYGDDFDSSDENYPDDFACAGLFKGNDVADKIDCSDLILSPYTTKGCYYNMFAACLGVIPPELPAITLTKWCYNNMFQDCKALTTAPELPATTLAEYCYYQMFENCTSLTTAPKLPAVTLVERCYDSMFQGCTSLTTAPVLPATTLAKYCYSSMFYDCKSLTTPPALPATTLTYYCYNAMFKGCTSLTTAPELPATTLATGCYQQMLQGCTQLNYIKAMFTTTPSTTYTNYWVEGVKSTGTFVKNSAASWTTTGVNGVPTGWTVQTA